MTEPPAPAAHPRDDAVIDLLGALSYAQLTGFQALASAAGRAPDLRTTTSFARLAVAMFSRFERVGARLAGLGVAQPDAMAPFVAAIDAFHARTAPSDWLEAIVKAYVGDGIVRDFYTQMAAHLDPDNRDFVVRLIGDAGAAETIVALVRPR